MVSGSEIRGEALAIRGLGSVPAEILHWSLYSVILFGGQVPGGRQASKPVVNMKDLDTNSSPFVYFAQSKTLFADVGSSGRVKNGVGASRWLRLSRVPASTLNLNPRPFN